MIDIIEEGVQGADPLLDPAFEEAPFGGGDDAGDQVERDDPFIGLGRAVDGEGDAKSAENGVRFLLFVTERGTRLRTQPFHQFGVGLSRGPIQPQHFIEERRLTVRRVGLGFQHGTASPKGGIIGLRPA